MSCTSVTHIDKPQKQALLFSLSSLSDIDNGPEISKCL